MRLYWRIITESIGVLLLASLLSTLGGFGLQSIQQNLFFLLPLLILMPALNDMTGDYGGIVASRFTTMLVLGKIKPAHWWRSHELHRLLGEVLIIGTFSAVYITVLATAIAHFRGFAAVWDVFQRILLIALFTTWLLVLILFVICVLGGFYVYKKKHDPDNYLIPLATGLADLGSMVVLTVLVRALF
jgi:cation transporter-like permease